MRSSCVRGVFLAFNVLFCVFGVVLAALGLFAEFDPAFVHRLVTFVDGIEDALVGDADGGASSSSSSTSSDDDGFYAVATYVRLMSHCIIALGGAIAVVGFTGCFGSWRQSKFCLSFFFALLLLCLLLTLLLGGALFFAAVAATKGADEPEATPSSSSASSSPLDPVVAKIAAGFKSLVEAAWNALTRSQRLAFERANLCCSLYDPEDILGVLGRVDCGSNMASGGCFDKLVGGICRNFAIFGGAMTALAALEIAAMALSCIIFQRIRREYAAV